MATPPNEFDAAKNIVDQLSAFDKEQQRRILRWVSESLALDTGLPALPSQRAVPPALSDVSTAAETADLRRPIDLKTFVERKSPKSDVQFAAVVAYYYQFEAPGGARQEAIDASILKEAARLAGRRRPPSAINTLHNAKQLGYLDSSDRGRFRLNSIGENLVAMTLPASQGEGRRAKRRQSS